MPVAVKRVSILRGVVVIVNPSLKLKVEDLPRANRRNLSSINAFLI
jgi:hypothetical protein